MLIIVDYDIGNLASLKNMLKRIGAEATVASSANELEPATKIILPGFGAFDTCAQKLQQSGLIPELNTKIIEKKVPLLGICVGMQLLFQGSEEGELPGLNWIKGKNVRFMESQMPKGYKVPHMGWTDVRFEKKSKLVEGLEEEARFYFGHSYHAMLQEQQDALVSADYGYRFVAGVARENILGVQFHPEKSHRFGMKLLDNFVKSF